MLPASGHCVMSIGVPGQSLISQALIGRRGACIVLRLDQGDTRMPLAPRNVHRSTTTAVP